ncbi:formate dehydrogenase accessory sulfurtransferase FdhD [Brevibacterium casei]|nr:formate dehydrogenase accessory sulfurtransferase FdhD [Brevibacterium casei]
MADIAEIDFRPGSPPTVRGTTTSPACDCDPVCERGRRARPVRLHVLVVRDLRNRGHRRGDEALGLPAHPAPRRRGDQATGTGTAPAEGGGPDAEPEARGGGIAVPSDAPHLDEDGDIVFPPPLSPARVGELPDRLREGQAVFEKTGGVHAAALFAVGDDPDAEPELLVTREDVGRHNAVDKVIGWAMAERGPPLSRTVLQVSARASFELVQKSAMAGIPMMSAVSAPSALAFDYGRTSGVTVIGFNRGGRFNVYSHPERIA